MVSAEHFKICSHVVSQCNRLCFLKVCKSRHVCLDIFLHHMEDHFQKFFYLGVNLVDLVSGEKLHI